MILGLDIGGTKTALILGDRMGVIHARRQFPTPLQVDAVVAIDQITLAAHSFITEHGPAGVEAVGVSIGGPLDSASGVILGPPHLPGWDEVPLRAMLEQRLGLPVYVEHDARTGALAEWRFGSGRQADGTSVSDLIFLTLGTGLGAGIISGGRVLHGASTRTAEAGHWRIAADGPEMFGKRGSWESYCSGAGIAALAAWRHPERFGQILLPDLAALARAGDPDAQSVFQESAHYLGYGIALLCDVFVPDVVALGALGLRLGDLLIPGAIQTLRAEALPAVVARCRVVPVALGEQIGDVAAVCAALYRLEGWAGEHSTHAIIGHNGPD